MGPRASQATGGLLVRSLARVRANPEPYLLDAAVALACLVALVHGLRVVWDLSWPCDVDLYRDIGFAQSIRDGDLLGDPLYLGERAWYNPLVPGLIALGSLLSGQPVHLVGTKMGAVVDLISPLGFYVMASCLLGRRTGAVGTVVFLFAGLGQMPSWAAAAYSPWLWPSNFVQGLFYLALAAHWQALRSQRYRWHLGSGALLGLTFLGHTAPALILGGIVVVTFVRQLASTWVEEPASPARHRAVLSLLLTLGTALVVSLPYAASIVFHYGLEVKNPEPASWLWGKITLYSVADFIAANFSLLTVVPAMGLLAVVLRRRSSERVLVLTWLALAALLFAYTYVWQAFKLVGVQVPRIVPGHHFLIYLKAVEALLFGHGLLLLLRYLPWLARHLVPSLDRALTSREAAGPWIARATVAIALLGTFAVAYPSYAEREDYTMEPYKARRLALTPPVVKAHSWIMANTKTTDVFLAGDHHTLHLLSASGRKVVATLAYFSNPFVDWKTRHTERHRMFSVLDTGDTAAFLQLARKYSVRYVLLDPGQRPNPAYAELLPVVLDTGALRIHKVPLQ